jgi:hypothetical protein
VAVNDAAFCLSDIFIAMRLSVFFGVILGFHRDLEE